MAMRMVTQDEIVPSFHRIGLSHIPDNENELENRYSFRPVLTDRMNNETGEFGGDRIADPNTYATCNGRFPNIFYDHDDDPDTLPITFLHHERPLDVDNDYDGILDSVWIDAGFSPTTDESGRLIKPLIAPLIIDLDGRLNVNAHGDYVQGQSVSTVGDSSLRRGFGMGPGEIRLPPSIEERLLRGTSRLPGRYGDDRQPGHKLNPWFKIRTAGYPRGSAGSFQNSGDGIVGGLFGSHHMDIRGVHGYGFLESFDPIFPQVTHGVPRAGTFVPGTVLDNPDERHSSIEHSPYQMDLIGSVTGNGDQLFTEQELERVLRRNDRDAFSLPNRLYSLLGEWADQSADLITTRGFEVPRPLLLRDLVQSGSSSSGLGYQLKTVVQVLQEQLEQNGIDQTPDLKTQLHLMLAPEVIRGLPMDVNRMFGDGVDNDGDGVVDEHWESDQPQLNEAMVETVWATDLDLPDSINRTFSRDHDNDGYSGTGSLVDEDDFLSRQIFARHLFVLVWMVAGERNPNATILPPDMNGDGARTDADIDALAQWCINVVDFRDADSIMSPFEYDRQPFDGWGVDGFLDPAHGGDTESNKGIVWGAERPELLIHETISTHDRKTHDLPTGNLGVFDSEMVPVASSFVELYSPWYSGQDTEGKQFRGQQMPAELYRANGGLDLAQTVPGQAGAIPVWRLAFTEDSGGDPMDGRRVYFIEPGTREEFPNAVEDPDHNRMYFFPDSTVRSDMGLLFPGGYAVIGSSGIEFSSGSRRHYRTTFGRRTDAIVDHNNHANTDLRLEETRNITLIPGQGVQVQNGDSATAEARDCLAIPINRWGGSADPIRSFGLSDPDEGYLAALLPDNPGLTVEEFNPDGIDDNGDGDGLIFGTTLQPIVMDFSADVQAFGRGAKPWSQDGYHPAFRWVQLQRLANPQAPFDEQLNPYLTVDQMPVDLIVFNGNVSDQEPGTSSRPAEFRAHERGYNESQQVADRFRRRLLWRPEMDSLPPDDDRPGVTVSDHHFDLEFFESLGQINRAHRGSEFAADGTDARLPIHFGAFTWHNAPFNSQFDLALVPLGPPRNASAVQSAQTFDILASYSLVNQGREPNHLLAFRDPENSLNRVFEFLEVPTRFVGTHLFLKPDIVSHDTTPGMRFNPPYNRLSRHRVPGKVNLNTILSGEVWEAVVGGYETIAYSEWADSRSGGSGGFTHGDNPIRAMQFDEFYPDHLGTDVGVNCSVQRQQGLGRMFDYQNLASFHDTSRNEVFRNIPISRLANMSTNRSSVFAIWITVGFFEVDRNGLLGAEMGADVGEHVRHRGFWIVDRSIPVGFEPGVNHNVERAILVQSMSE